MANWLARMFTVPRKVREQIAQIPGAHAIGQAVQAETVAVAQHAVDALGLDPALAEQIKTSIEVHVQQAVPIPTPPANEGVIGQVVDGLVGSALGHLAGPPPIPTPAEP